MEKALQDLIKSKAMKYCSSRERAPQQVREKLKKWGANHAEIDGIIQQLIKDNFLNEERFANAYCHDKFEFNKWGKIKIRYGIQKYQLPEAVVDAGISNISDKRYFEVLKDQASKKWISLDRETDTYTRKQKTANFLIRRGFESSVIYPVLDKL